MCERPFKAFCMFTNVQAMWNREVKIAKETIHTIEFLILTQQQGNPERICDETSTGMLQSFL
nr:BFH_HP1_G0048550.mRNA.1.CDS.1 [Saccharomyces cerevisiae]